MKKLAISYLCLTATLALTLSAWAQTPVLDNIWNYDQDNGQAFEKKASGFQFGWKQAMSGKLVSINKNGMPDARYAQGISLGPGSQWEMALRNGWYRITATIGTSKPSAAFAALSAEGQPFMNTGNFKSDWPWLTQTMDIQVTDGRVTLKSESSTKHVFIAHLHINSSIKGRYDKPAQVELPFAVNMGGQSMHGYVADKPWIDNADHGFVLPRIIDARVDYIDSDQYKDQKHPDLFKTLRATASEKIPLIYRLRTRPNAECIIELGFINDWANKSRRLILSAAVNGTSIMPATEFSQNPGYKKAKTITARVQADAKGIIEVAIKSEGSFYPRAPHLAYLKLQDAAKPQEVKPVTVKYPEMGQSIKINFGKSYQPIKLTENKYLEAAKRFANAMRQYGRNANGEFFKEIDIARKQGLHVGDPNVDQDVYRLMYLISHVNGDMQYRAAADKGIRHFLRHRSGSGIITWAEGGGAINCENDQLPVINDDLWRLEPLRMLIAAYDYWENGIGDKETGDFDRHCSSTATGVPFARHGGAMINMWMEAYKRTHDPDLLAHARLLTNFYNDLMKVNQYNYWTSPVEMVIILGTAINLNQYALINDQEEQNFMMDFARRNSQIQLKNNVWSRHQLHADAVMANRYYQLIDAGETALADAFRDKYISILKKKYADIKKSGISEQSKDIGAVILALLAAYKISEDKELLALTKKWADYGLKAFMTKTDLPPLVLEGEKYGRRSGGSNGGNTPSTLPLGLFLLGMELERPEQRLLLINAPF